MRCGFSLGILERLEVDFVLGCVSFKLDAGHPGIEIFYKCLKFCMVILPDGEYVIYKPLPVEWLFMVSIHMFFLIPAHECEAT